MERTSDYWFMIEPYVHINIANGYMLLYNTLDKETIISNNEKVINLLEELLQDENCGVTILKNEQYRQNDIHSFITNLREKYMGDIIDISLSKGKPIQILPHTNFCNKRNEKYNFIKNANLLHFLNEIIIHLDHILDQDKLIDYLQSMPDNITYSISGDLKHIAKFDKLVDFLNQYNSSKKIICNYINFAIPASVCKNIFLYKIHIHFPIDIKQKISTTLYDKVTTGLHCGINLRMMRYSDVLLRAAECENEVNGPTQQAIDWINQVRERANLKDLKLSDFNSKDKLFEQIANVERPKEFGCEYGRGFDLIRWGFFYDQGRLAQLKEHGTFRRSPYKAKEAVSYSMVGVDPELKSSYDTYVPGHEFLPIYQGLLNDNPNLTGNSANTNTDNSSDFFGRGWTVHPVVNLGN